MRTVCKDCPDRVVQPNCHMTCKKYLKEVEDNNKINRYKKFTIHNDNYFDGHRKRKK